MSELSFKYILILSWELGLCQQRRFYSSALFPRRPQGPLRIPTSTPPGEAAAPAVTAMLTALWRARGEESAGQVAHPEGASDATDHGAAAVAPRTWCWAYGPEGWRVRGGAAEILHVLSHVGTAASRPGAIGTHTQLPRGDTRTGPCELHSLPSRSLDLLCVRWHGGGVREHHPWPLFVDCLCGSEQRCGRGDAPKARCYLTDGRGSSREKGT